jgi:23S rRNA (uracil1939-C5)-methyltransferase
VADLFSGLGTFTFALASKSAVTAAESDPALLAALTAAARHATGLKPVTALRRDLMREPLSWQELNAFDAVVFDPPRAGAIAQTQALARSKVARVVAVSCNPATFARDARALIDGGYRLTRLVPVDQFVFSPHVELVGWFARK